MQGGSEEAEIVGVAARVLPVLSEQPRTRPASGSRLDLRSAAPRPRTAHRPARGVPPVRIWEERSGGSDLDPVQNQPPSGLFAPDGWLFFLDGWLSQIGIRGFARESARSDREESLAAP